MGKQRYVKYLSNEHCMFATDNLEMLLLNRKKYLKQTIGLKKAHFTPCGERTEF